MAHSRSGYRSAHPTATTDAAESLVKLARTLCCLGSSKLGADVEAVILPLWCFNLVSARGGVASASGVTGDRDPDSCPCCMSILPLPAAACTALATSAAARRMLASTRATCAQTPVDGGSAHGSNSVAHAT